MLHLAESKEYRNSENKTKTRASKKQTNKKQAKQQNKKKTVASPHSVKFWS